MSNIIIRTEDKSDYREVEELIKKSFWNVNMPGCNEHFLAHKIRGQKDFISELDLVLEVDGKIVANIMYTKSKLIDENNNEKEILSFGPFCVQPEYQRKGYGKKLLNYSFEKASDMGYDTIVIFGNPENYICSGFKSCKRYLVSTPDMSSGEPYYPVAMLVKTLKDGVLDNKKWVYKESPIFDIDYSEFDEFDKSFEQMKKEYKKSQELFYIYSKSKVVW